MPKKYNDAVDAVLQELRQHGLKPRVEIGRKHCRIVFLYRGQPHAITAGVSPSDWRAPVKARAYVRRLLKTPSPT